MIRALALAATLAGSGCTLLAPRAVDPMPTAMIDAPLPLARPERAVIVLPGRGDDLEGLRASGIAAAIQQGAPDTDVLLTGASLAYYLDGGIRRRVRALVDGLRAQGYREIWLAGASMGGMGALLHERDLPGDVAGLLLMAPYMGDADVIREVAQAGGPRAWDPGPEPATIDGDNAARETWRAVRRWAERPELAQRVWLVCGADDRFVEAARMIAPLLPSGHYLERPGGHAWKVWSAGAAEAMQSATQTLYGARGR